MLTALLMLLCMSANAQVKGDVNGDLKVDNADIEEVVKIITGTSTLENADVVGDVTEDGHVNVADIVAIVNIMMTLPPPSGDEVYNFRIINNSGTTVTLNGEMCFVLANPDVNGEYHGWEGAYNRTGHIPYSGSTVTIGNGDMQTFAVSSDELVNRNPIDPSLLPAGNYNKNVYLYVTEPDGTANSEIAICNNMAPSVFQNGGTYDIVITSYGSVPPPSGGEVVPPSGSEVYNFRIINQSGTTVTLNGEMCFVLGNPDVYGNYHGWNGAYNRTGHIPFSYSTVTIGNGDMQTFSVSTDELVNRNPIDPNLLPAGNYSNNVYLYVLEPDGTANSEIAICNNMAPNVFQNGGTYDIVISAFRW